MSETKPRCRYVEGFGYFLPSHEATCRAHDCEGCEPCTEAHCTARKTCTGHVEPGQLTCPHCVGKTRTDLAEIERLAALLPDEAEHKGVDSEAAMLAGPALDTVETIKAADHRLLSTILGRVDGPIEEHGHHPLTVLGWWDMALREDYDLPTALRITVPRAVAFLDGLLTRLAQDHDQDWPAFANEVHACRAHLEDVLSEGVRAERGAPCPACTKAPPLVKRWAHWCEDPECCREHDATGASDTWRCPWCKAKWSEAEYRKWVADDYLERVEEMTAPELRQAFGIKAATFRSWLHREKIKPIGRDSHDRLLYDASKVRELLRDTRKRGALA